MSVYISVILSILAILDNSIKYLMVSCIIYLMCT